MLLLLLVRECVGYSAIAVAAAAAAAAAGYAYIEFGSEIAAQHAVLLSDSTLKDRQIKVRLQQLHRGFDV